MIISAILCFATCDWFCPMTSHIFINADVQCSEKSLAQYMNTEYTIAKDNKKVTNLLEKWSVLQKVML